MNEVEGFSVIIPTYQAAEELRICLDSFAKNSRLQNEFRVYVNPDDSGRHDPDVVNVVKDFDVVLTLNETPMGPYGAWNRGAREAKNELLCFITDDQYWAPGWDEEIWRYVDDYPILTGQIVESGVVGAYPTNIVKNFGESAENFDEAAFLEFVRDNSDDRVAHGGFYIPTVMRKALFDSLGGWPDEHPFPYPNDWYFRLKLFERGLEYDRVCSSFTYHFQNTSSKEGQPTGMHFDRKAPDVAVPGAMAQMIASLRRRAGRVLRTLGLRSRSISKTTGYMLPKKTDEKLLYEYCVGRGLEIEPGLNRLPNLNTRAVDLIGEAQTSEYPVPELDANAYDLSSVESSSVDYVVNSHLIERLGDPIRALMEWRRVLGPDGVLVMIVGDKRLRASGRSQPETVLEEIIERYDRGQENGIATASSLSGRDLVNFWTPDSLTKVLEHVGFNLERVVEAAEKDTGLDRPGWDYDDFTIVARTEQVE